MQKMASGSYLQGILSKYNVQYGNNSPSHQLGNTLYSVIKEWAGSNLLDVCFSGSYAKRTAVKTSRDLDLFISLSDSTSDTLEELYNKLYSFFSSKGYSTRKQNVSIGIKVDELSVDLIPGKKRSGNTNYHSIWKNKQKTWVQTNIQKQIDEIKNSGRQDEIKIIKIWRDLHKLEFPSFYLELTVLDALYGKSTNNLSSNVWSVLGYLLSSEFREKKIVDPANTNNIISDELSTLEKLSISIEAMQSRLENNWNKIVW